VDIEKTRNDFSNAVKVFNNQKTNLTLSQRIYDKTLTKYKEGMAGSMDLTQANNQLLDAQSNYYQAMLNVLQQKVLLNKKLNRL
jgi:outer membrane protein TolC